MAQKPVALLYKQQFIRQLHLPLPPFLKGLQPN
jgi:hypothetical protein